MTRTTTVELAEEPAAVTVDSTSTVGGGRLGRVMIRMVRGYQLARSGRPTGCRYLPSCSEYAIEAIEGHGSLRGGALAARRLARCTPWGGHGVDPVPDRRTPCTHP